MILTFDYIKFQCIVHEKYKDKILSDDIALLKLRRKIIFVRNNVIAPICLPVDPLDDFNNVKATAIGWGGIYWSNYIYFT